MLCSKNVCNSRTVAQHVFHSHLGFKRSTTRERSAEQKVVWLRLALQQQYFISKLVIEFRVNYSFGEATVTRKENKGKLT